MDPQQNNLQLPEEEGIDIKKYIFLILSHWWWFGISLFVSLTIAYLVNRYSQRIYSVKCSLIIGEQKEGIGTIENILDEFTRVRKQKRKAVVENEISVLRSYSMARKALEELNFGITYTEVGRRNIAERVIYQNAPFVVVPDTSREIFPHGTYYITILSKEEYLISIPDEFEKIYRFGELFERNNIAFTIYLDNHISSDWNNIVNSRYYFKFNNINGQANQYSNLLGVSINDEKGSIITISISGYAPQKISDYLNKLAEVYVRSNLEEKNVASINTISFIDMQLQGIVDSLEETSIRLQDFRSKNKVINISKEGTFLFEKMQELHSEKTLYDVNDKYYNYLVEYIDTKRDYSDIIAPAVIGIQDPLLNKLVAKLNDLNLQRKSLNLTLMAESPQLSLINSEYENTRNALMENLKSLVNTNSIAQEKLEERIYRIEKQVQKLPGTERRLLNIQREFTINDQIYTFLLEKRAEAGIARASNTSNHKILDIARPENAILVQPKTSMNYMMGLVIGIGIPLALLLLIEFFNTKITDRKYLESNLRVPIIGNIGHNDENTELPVAEKPNSSLSESFRALRSNLQYILKNKEKGIIAVTSAVSGEGKTFCSVNLASILSLSGKKTLLISLDLRRPKVHRVFNLPNKKGMSTYLIGKTDFEDTLQETNLMNLFVSTSGPVPPNPSELIASSKMKEYLDKAQETFDYIIVDTPPVAIVTDTLELKDQVDALVFVIRHNYSEKQVIELINSMKERNIVNNLEIVVNDIQIKGYYGYTYRYGYGYGYGYSYSYGYRSYYGEEKDRKDIFKWIRDSIKFK